MKIATSVAITVAFTVLAALALNEALDRQEIADCQKWADQAGEYNGFFLAKWQDEQCRYHGVLINAVVVK